MKELGFGIVGAGFMGQTYARTISSLLPGARLAAVSGGARAAGLAEEYGADYELSLEALLAREDVHAVCIATPHAQHGPQALAAARAGKHLLIDKPMATSVAQCDAILRECEARGLRCEITYTQRERVCNLETKRLLDSGELGKICHFRNSQVVPQGMESTPKWQLLPENIGILMGHGIHNLDQVRWFTGQEVARVYARLSTFDAQYEVDSTANLVLTLVDGTVCTVFCSFEVPAPGIPRTGGATQIICERGIIDSDWYGELRVSRDGAPFEVLARQEPIDWAGKGFLDPVRLQTYAATLRRLCAGITAGEGFGGTGWDGRQAVAIAEAAYQSSRACAEIAPAP